MTIAEVIQKMKRYHYGYVRTDNGVESINEEATRDKILFGKIAHHYIIRDKRRGCRKIIKFGD